MKIGVVGARGRLGSAIVGMLQVAEGVEAVAIDTPKADLNAVINTAPLTDVHLHREALDYGCHVVDVTINPDLIRSMLALDEVARQQNLCLIAMAGLAPGLTGLLGRELMQECPQSSFVQVSLLQSASGKSGKQGTMEMLDLLTSPDCKFAKRPYPQSHKSQTSWRRLFDFANPELMFLPDADRLRLVTGFDNDNLNRMIRGLAWIRQVFPAGYFLLARAIAQIKAKANKAVDEAIEVGAVTLDQDGNVLTGRCLKLDSDYGTTAAIAIATAMLAIQGLPTFGAGHLNQFITLDTLLNHPVVKPHLLNG